MLSFKPEILSKLLQIEAGLESGESTLPHDPINSVSPVNNLSPLTKMH